MDESRIWKLKETIDIPHLIEQPVDLLYLTGLALSKGRLLLSRNEAILFVDGRYYEKAKEEAPCPVRLWDEFKKVSKKQIAFDSASTTYDGFLGLKKAFPLIEWIPRSNPWRDTRAVKESQEIGAVRKAADLT